MTNDNEQLQLQTVASAEAAKPAVAEVPKTDDKYEGLVDEYRELLTQKFRNSNKYIIEIKAGQAALKRMELERRGAPLHELRGILTEAKKDAVAMLLMELGDFLGDQQMVRSGKATRNFLQWGIKHIVTKLNTLGLEMEQKDIKELTVDVCLDRIEKLKQKRTDLESQYRMTTAQSFEQRVVS